MSVRRLADLTWPEVRELAAGGAVLAVPVGSTEQHGPHLPLTTDTDIATQLCERLGQVRPEVVIAPAVPYGSSGEHAGFAGTISIGQQATELLLVELGRSACETFDRVLLVSAHGGNAAPVRRAAAKLQAESRDVVAFMPRLSGDAHAGRTETAMQLALRPQAVRTHLCEPGETRPLGDLIPTLALKGVRAVSGNGVLGDPRGASAVEGEALLETLTVQLVELVDNWHLAPVR